ncbi:Hypothetical predicted protein [Olea europaea subsp. europaea]|uniref:Transmembrane protein n=1 Tax=Olea europaea subsp. europaea TaxID=158383 RepID=A0A8S0UBL5_OLEEU|nr:Hypothetical predicted protein [Olea europaea subsp. europaea]
MSLLLCIVNPIGFASMSLFTSACCRLMTTLLYVVFTPTTLENVQPDALDDIFPPMRLSSSLTSVLVLEHCGAGDFGSDLLAFNLVNRDLDLICWWCLGGDVGYSGEMVVMSKVVAMVVASILDLFVVVVVVSSGEDDGFWWLQFGLFEMIEIVVVSPVVVLAIVVVMAKVKKNRHWD